MTNDSTASDGMKSPDRRQWTRLAPEQELVTVVTPDGPATASLTDESFGGVGLLLDDDVSLQENDVVCLLYYGAPMRGVVRRIARSDDGRGCTMGVEWLRSNVEEESADGHDDHDATIHFVHLSNIWLRCEILRDANADSVCVRLESGTELVAPKSIIASKRFSQRQEELSTATDRDLAILVGIYEIGGQSDRDATLAQILHHEYGRHVAAV